MYDTLRDFLVRALRRNYLVVSLQSITRRRHSLPRSCAASCVEASFLLSSYKEHIMGDKGGKKDKEKGQKQKGRKQDQKAHAKMEKQPKSSA
jgi:hypothetical protein